MTFRAQFARLARTRTLISSPIPQLASAFVCGGLFDRLADIAAKRLFLKRSGGAANPFAFEYALNPVYFGHVLECGTVDEKGVRYVPAVVDGSKMGCG